MKTEFVTTKENQDSIILVFDANGHATSTSIFINGNWVKTLDDSFTYFLGTNMGLKGNNVLVSTQVARVPDTIQSSTVFFRIDGAADVQPDNPVISMQDFVNGAPNVPHLVMYYFF